MLLIIVDAYSKWLEVKTTYSTTTTATITILDELFSRYGVPVTIVSDNGRQFVSAEFKSFLQTSGIKYHKLTAPYHPSTNGQAERYVQTVKNALNGMSTTQGSVQHNLNQFLQQYRKAPHAATGQPPAQLFLGRNIRTRLDLVRPDDVFTRMKEKQQQFNPSFRSFQPEQTIYFLSGNPRMDKWIPGKIVTRLGNLHYEVEYTGRVEYTGLSAMWIKSELLLQENLFAHQQMAVHLEVLNGSAHLDEFGSMETGLRRP